MSEWVTVALDDQQFYRKKETEAEQNNQIKTRDTENWKQWISILTSMKGTIGPGRECMQQL